MVVAITGYYGTGSSAVLDLLAEYEGCSEGGLRSYEHVPFYFPNGLFDLEYKLLYGNDPHRSDEAIKSFRQAMYALNTTNFGWCGSYQEKFGDEFKNIVDEFLNEITQFTCQGEWYNYYEAERFSFGKFLKDCVKTLVPGKKVLGKIGRLPVKLTVQNMELSFVSEEEFYSAAKKFVRAYLKMINRDGAPILLVDHLLFPHNACKLSRFFDEDFRLIVVDRDVRDMFVLCKYVWTSRGFTSPYPNDPKAFLSHWNNMKKAERRTDNPQVLYLHFEDLVYRYDETVAKIEKFTGLTPQLHLHPRTRFIPENSINNTQNFRIEEAWEDEVALFGEAGVDLYPFPYERKTQLEKTFDEQE